MPHLFHPLMTVMRLLTAIILVCFAGGLSMAGQVWATVRASGAGSGAPIAPEAIPVPVLAWEALASATYALGPAQGGPEDGRLVLVEGRLAVPSEPGVRFLLQRQMTVGDLTGDGIDDAVAVLMRLSPQEGLRYYLLPVRNAIEGPLPLTPLPLDARPAPGGVRIYDGEVHVYTAPAPAPPDAGNRSAQRYRLVGQQLIPIGAVPTLSREDWIDGRPVVYLTFDDGPSPKYTQPILDLLARYDARATFFVIGQTAQRYPELVEAIYQGGHAIGNHTWDHTRLIELEADEIVEQLRRSAEVLGDRMSPCLRPPRAALNDGVRAIVAREGYALAMWDIDTRDWEQPGAWSIAATVRDHVYPGAIVLMHDGGGDRAQTVAALEQVLRDLARQGYRFEALCSAR